MGVIDRRLFACPAVIPHDVENGLFAGNLVTSTQLCLVPSRARILLGRDNRGSEHFGTSRARRTVLAVAQSGTGGPSSRGLGGALPWSGRAQAGLRAGLGPQLWSVAGAGAALLSVAAQLPRSLSASSEREPGSAA